VTLRIDRETAKGVSPDSAIVPDPRQQASPNRLPPFRDMP
jgi:hypothetical protein